MPNQGGNQNPNFGISHFSPGPTAGLTPKSLGLDPYGLISPSLNPGSNLEKDPWERLDLQLVEEFGAFDWATVTGTNGEMPKEDGGISEAIRGESGEQMMMDAGGVDGTDIVQSTVLQDGVIRGLESSTAVSESVVQKPFTSFSEMIANDDLDGPGLSLIGQSLNPEKRMNLNSEEFNFPTLPTTILSLQTLNQKTPEELRVSEAQKAAEMVMNASVALGNLSSLLGGNSQPKPTPQEPLHISQNEFSFSQASGLVHLPQDPEPMERQMGGASDEDSDGPLPFIVDGDPDREMA